MQPKLVSSRQALLSWGIDQANPVPGKGPDTILTDGILMSNTHTQTHREKHHLLTVLYKVPLKQTVSLSSRQPHLK